MVVVPAWHSATYSLGATVDAAVRPRGVVERVPSRDAIGQIVSSGFAVSDMTDIYCAARQYMKHIDSLIAQEPGPENARLLVGIQGWLYGELDDHLRGLKDPLNELIDDLYDHWPEE